MPSDGDLMTKAIGQLTDTPDTGDPILSPWYQEAATYMRHIYPTKAALDTWTDAPNGAEAWVTDKGRQYTRFPGLWYPVNAVLADKFHTGSGPINSGTGTAWPNTPAVQIPAGRRLWITGSVNLSGSGTSIYMNAVMDGVVVAGSSRMAQLNSLPTGGAILQGSIPLAPAAGTHSFSMFINCIGSVTHESTFDPSWVQVLDIGGNL